MRVNQEYLQFDRDKKFTKQLIKVAFSSQEIYVSKLIAKISKVNSEKTVKDAVSLQRRTFLQSYALENWMDYKKQQFAHNGVIYPTCGCRISMKGSSASLLPLHADLWEEMDDLIKYIKRNLFKDRVRVETYLANAVSFSTDKSSIRDCRYAIRQVLPDIFEPVIKTFYADLIINKSIPLFSSNETDLRIQEFKDDHKEEITLLNQTLLANLLF